MTRTEATAYISGLSRAEKERLNAFLKRLEEKHMEKGLAVQQTGLQIFQSPQFGKIRVIGQNGEPWFVAADVCRALEHSNVSMALDRLDDDEKAKLNLGLSGGATNCVSEPGLYCLVLGSRKPEARAFKRWVTHDVIPSIRKTGGYALPKDYPSALRALADSEEQRLALTAENELQRQQIADFQPLRQYLDTILSSTGTMAITQIAADYDLSAKRLNQILNEAGIQHKVNGQWILYREYMGKGYTESVTISITHKDGPAETKVVTYWSQKGRILIHQILTQRGILAKMDRPVRKTK